MTDRMQKALADAKADMAARTAREREVAAKIGTHLATLNLFREADGSVRITIADGRGARLEPECDKYPRPIDYVETLVIEAAYKLKPKGKAA